MRYVGIIMETIQEKIDCPLCKVEEVPLFKNKSGKPCFICSTYGNTVVNVRGNAEAFIAMVNNDKEVAQQKKGEEKEEKEEDPKPETIVLTLEDEDAKEEEPDEKKEKVRYVLKA